MNVVGLGYVGAEICLAAIEAGHRVAAIDRDPARLATLREPGDPALPDEWTGVRAAIAAGQVELHASVDTAPPADFWVVAVPTPLDEQGLPDTGNITDAATALAGVVTPGAVVVLESTSYPGTTEEIFLPPFLAAGWTPGVDLFVGFSPERINPGSADWTMRTIPKLVSGCTDECLKVITEFYRTVVDEVRPMSSTRAAEMAKLYENSWRLVNIAFANENEALCVAFGLDPWEVNEACRTKPFGYHGFDPGPGAGGHCIPVDAGYLAHYARTRGQGTPVLSSALAANHERPSVIVARIREHLPAERARVLLIGVAYKANVADVRESPAVQILDQLALAGVEVAYHDPHVPVLGTAAGPLHSVPLDPDGLGAYDCVAVLTGHTAVDFSALSHCPVPVVDTRNVRGVLGGPR
ncbi:UDP-N-acetyl-D-glucosamine dehydrogenase [Crossiella equi]|uniref:UDP-N-acetyl-D-glucosamine dehydrogenase n=1 Tax=Crossiella equi TaxID=130796 RepID=A0ABS5A6R3_9PSEU|nr:nucleotide sugar dehydrogenase [Crossiella equi]MBP2471917.1 UDP-N-acetyl-D-glucosamine dehydrogenase [Crossiella equi]